jgi:hypothetical protein
MKLISCLIALMQLGSSISTYIYKAAKIKMYKGATKFGETIESDIRLENIISEDYLRLHLNINLERETPTTSFISNFMVHETNGKIIDKFNVHLQIPSNFFQIGLLTKRNHLVSFDNMKKGPACTKIGIVIMDFDLGVKMYIELKRSRVAVIKGFEGYLKSLQSNCQTKRNDIFKKNFVAINEALNSGAARSVLDYFKNGCFGLFCFDRYIEIKSILEEKSTTLPSKSERIKPIIDRLQKSLNKPVEMTGQKLKLK